MGKYSLGYLVHNKMFLGSVQQRHNKRQGTAGKYKT